MRAMPIERLCENPTCGTLFTTIPSRIAQGKDRFCSKACADVYKRRQQVACICPNPSCGKVFMQTASAVARGRRFCSADCARPPVIQTCQNPICGKSFCISPAEIRKGGGKYCSWECRPKAYQRLCKNPQCRKPFSVIPSEDTSRYCSAKCRSWYLGSHWEERFWSHVTRCDHETWCPYCCWEWQASTTMWGYGLFQMKTDTGKWRGHRAHRIAWTLLNAQPIPPGLLGLHHCDNPPCCNPMHIHIGNHLDNSHDATMRGRLNVPRYGQFSRGEERWNSQLTEETVREIVHRHRRGELHSVIAKDLGVSRSLITMVLHGEIWRHVTETMGVVTSDDMHSNNHVGECHTHAKLTNEQVRQIRTLFLQGHLMADIARQFAVHFTTISAIIHGKTWKHIPWPDHAVQLFMF